jgi:hypothetical protein
MALESYPIPAVTDRSFQQLAAGYSKPGGVRQANEELAAPYSAALVALVDQALKKWWDAALGGRHRTSIHHWRDTRRAFITLRNQCWQLDRRVTRLPRIGKEVLEALDQFMSSVTLETIVGVRTLVPVMGRDRKTVVRALAIVESWGMLTSTPQGRSKPRGYKVPAQLHSPWVDWGPSGPILNSQEQPHDVVSSGPILNSQVAPDPEGQVAPFGDPVAPFLSSTPRLTRMTREIQNGPVLPAPLALCQHSIANPPGCPACHAATEPAVARPKPDPEPF